MISKNIFCAVDIQERKFEEKVVWLVGILIASLRTFPVRDPIKYQNICSNWSSSLLDVAPWISTSDSNANHRLHSWLNLFYRARKDSNPYSSQSSGCEFYIQTHTNMNHIFSGNFFRFSYPCSCNRQRFCFVLVRFPTVTSGSTASVVNTIVHINIDTLNTVALLTFIFVVLVAK